MEFSNKTLIITPAFNEEKNIANVISDILNLSHLTNILVVDDGSTDTTAHVSKQTGANVISLPFNMGYGAALQTGFKYAFKNKYNYVVHMDADGQHEPRSIKTLLDEIRKEEVDIVIGSRFLDNPDYPLDFLRKIGIAIFKVIIKLFTKQEITDPTSGFQALNRKAFEFYSNIYPSDFPDADVIISSHLARLKIKEIPVKFYPKPFGKSMHSGIKPFYYAFKMFLSIFVTLLRKKPEVSFITREEKDVI